MYLILYQVSQENSDPTNDIELYVVIWFTFNDRVNVYVKSLIILDSDSGIHVCNQETSPIVVDTFYFKLQT